MGKGEENSLFRMNFIIQGSDATTFDANLVQVIEAAIYEANSQSLTYGELQEQIRDLCGLTFSLDELRTAVRKKGRGNLLINGNGIALAPEYRLVLSRRSSFDEELRKYARMAIEVLQLQTSVDRLSSLLTKYLYFCFNSNKDTLLALINNSPLDGGMTFEGDNAEIGLINQFLDWDNEGKNRFIYNAVSYCYIYCTLTVKKDVARSKNLFHGKTFVLDANIIFRMAGINNDVRKFETATFIEKCREVGIKLCYTDRTLDEIYRVIRAKVSWIREITCGQRPLDLRAYDQGQDDFYGLYYGWVNDGAHQPGDYAGFQKYLTGLINGVLGGVHAIHTPDFCVERGSVLEEYMERLREYKSTHGNLEPSGEALLTDVSNLMFIQKERKRQGGSMWSTQDYLISADQNLIAWAQTIDTGVPLVVLPSTWLTVILRFSGRSSDDYRAFCSFLRLHAHVHLGDIDVYRLVECLSEKTSNNDLKMSIVQEVFEHKERYDITDDRDYEETVSKAFDVIAAQVSASDRELILELEAQSRESNIRADEATDAMLKEQAENERRLTALVSKDEEKHFRIVAAVGNTICVIVSVLAAFLVAFFVMAVFRVGLIHHFLVETLNRPDLAEPGILVPFVCAVVSAVSMMARGAFKYVRNLGSLEQRDKYRRKRLAHYEKVFEELSHVSKGGTSRSALSTTNN